jgi:hypothetical protein
MTLAEFCRRKSITATALADMLGISGAGRARTAQRYTSSQRIPDRAMIRRIEEITEGSVTWADWPDAPVRAPAQSSVAA